MESQLASVCVRSSVRWVNRALLSGALALLFASRCRAQTPGLEDLRRVTQRVSDLNRSAQYTEAFTQGSPMLANAENLLTPSDGDLLQMRLQMSYVLMNLGRKQESENQARLIVRYASPFGATPLLRDALSQLTTLISADGRLVEGRQAAHAVLSVQRQLPKDDAALALSLNGCSILDTAFGDNANAISELLEIRGLLGSLEGETLRKQQFLLVLGLISAYRSTGDHAKLPPLLKEAQGLARNPAEIALVQQVRDLVDTDSATMEGKLSEALAHLLSSQNSYLADLPTEQPYMVARMAANRALLYYESNDVTHATEAFRQAIHGLHSIFETRFLMMTESEKHQFVTDITPTMSAFYSFCLKNQVRKPELVDDAYSLALWQKSMVADSLRGTTSKVAADSNGDILVAERALQTEKIRFAEELRDHPGSLLLPSLQTRLDSLERDLGAKLTAARYSSSVTVADLRRVLPNKDAAVEVVTFQMFDEQGTTNRTVYAAIVLKPGAAHTGAMVRLGDAQTIEASQTLLAYDTGARKIPASAIPQIRMYTSLPWQGMEPLLLGSRRIYLSPAGILNATPFYAWKHSDGRYLLDHEEIDLRPVFSTAELAFPTEPNVKPKTAVLIGNADFGTADAAPSAATGAGPRLSPLGTTAFNVAPLPATHPELTDVEKVLRNAGFQLVGPLEQKDATKAALLAVREPSVLHIATHGYFLPSVIVGAEMDPLGLEVSTQRSGLLLAGVNRAPGIDPSGRPADNGVVTAFESAGLDLKGTELVALSACETGLGDRSTDGEVLGLRRAFHIAGAKKVLVSMWSVDDTATHVLMKMFYEKWIKYGEDPYQALRQAALEIKSANDSPHIWAPFVLYGP